MAVVDRPEIQLTARDATKAAFDSVKRSFGDLQRQATTVRAAFVSLAGVLSATALTSFIRGGIDSAAALDDLSEKTSLTVETLSSLQRVAIIGGHSLDTVGGAAGKFARSVAEAAGGNKELIRAFDALGISQQRLQQGRFDDIFVEFATKIANAENRTYALAFATKLAGKNAAEALPFFRDLAEEGLKGATISADQAAKAEALQKAFNRLNFEFATTVRLPITKAILDLADALGVASSKAISLGDRFKLAFSGEVNVGRFAELRNRELALLKEIEDVPGRGLGQRLLEGPDAGRRKFLEEQLALVRSQRAELERLLNLRAEVSPPREATAEPFKLPAPSDESFGRDLERAAAARLALTEAQAKAVLDEEKRLADVRLDLLERFHGEGLIAERDYWQRRQQVQEAAIAASIAAVEKEVVARERALAEASRTKGPQSAEALSAEKELLEARTRRSQLEQDLANTTVRNFLDAQRAAESYADSLQGLNARLAELAGRSEDAAAINFDQQNRTLRQRFEAAGDEAGLRQLANLRAATIAQARFNDERERASLIQQGLSLQEERIQNSLRVGAISELEALRRTSSARQQSIDELAQVAAALDAAAESSGLPRLKLQADELRVQLEQLRAESDLVAQKFNTIFESGFTDFFGDVVSGAKSVKDAFKDMTDTIVREITRLATQDLARQLFGGAGGASGGIGGIFAKIFGGGGGGGGGLVDQFVGLETGTSFVPRTGLYMLHRGEAVTPAAQNRGGGVTIGQLVLQGTTDRRSAEQQAVTVGREINRALRRST